MKVNIQDLKADFPKFLRHLSKGKSFLLCKRNIPVAEVRPVSRPILSPRVFGKHKGWIEAKTPFDAPLDPKIVELFGANLIAADEDREL